MQPWFMASFMVLDILLRSSYNFQNKVSPDHSILSLSDHFILSRAQDYSSQRSRAHQASFWSDQGSRKVNLLYFFVYKNVFPYFCFVSFEIIQTRKPNKIQKTSTQSYKTQIKTLAYPGLA